MEVIFADSFYFIALLNDADAHHAQAVEFMAASEASLLTTDYVLIEVADALAETKRRTAIGPSMRFLLADPAIEVMEGTRELLRAGLTFYEARPDKRWSLTDCISYVVMNQRGITDALTHDHHFKQAGFRVLL